MPSKGQVLRLKMKTQGLTGKQEHTATEQEQDVKRVIIKVMQRRRCRRREFDPRVRKIPGGGNGNPLPES